MKSTSSKPRESEILNFFWNCYVAAKIIDEMPAGTATNACALYAIRKATLCYAGKAGVKYVSAGARKEASSGNWSKSGLIQEHVVPVSMIRERVFSDLVSTRNEPQELLVISDEDAKALSPKVVSLFQDNPRAWRVGSIVSKMTILAWVTKEEEAKFKDKKQHGGISLVKRMPLDWKEEHGWLSRYTACKIELSDL